MALGLIVEILLILIWVFLDSSINHKNPTTSKYVWGWGLLVGVLMGLTEITQENIPFWREILLFVLLLISGSLIHRGIIEDSQSKSKSSHKIH